MDLRRILLVLVPALLAANAEAKPLERVPEDGSLQQAIQRVSDGGVIEIAAGTYAAPSNGFRSVNLSKRFTIRAADGATVVLDGEGQNPIFLFGGKSVRDRIDFERIVFRDGLSTDPSRAAGVTVEGGRAFFTSCAFESNALTILQGGGGGLRAVGSAHAHRLR